MARRFSFISSTLIVSRFIFSFEFSISGSSYKTQQTFQEKYKEVIILYYYENLTINDIAQILNISSSNVKKRLERGRLKIKEAILDEGL